MTEPATVPRLEPRDQTALHEIIARVLMVPLASVRADADLVYDLGAESIDFLDLLFSLEPLVGGRVLPEHWAPWLAERLPQMRDNRGITTGIVAEFVIHERARTATQSQGETE